MAERQKWINYVSLDHLLQNVNKAVILAPSRSGKTSSIRLAMESLRARKGWLQLVYIGLTSELTEAFYWENNHLFPVTETQSGMVRPATWAALFVDEGLSFQADEIRALIDGRPYEHIYIFSSLAKSVVTDETISQEELTKEGFQIIEAPLTVAI